MTSSSNNELKTTAHLIEAEFRDLYLKWGGSQPPRSGLHASSLLVPDSEWCTRKHVLSALFPDEARQPELKYWDWRTQAIFENGWSLHKRWQMLFERFLHVVQTEITIDALPKPWKQMAPELDLTHHDEVRNIYFSPDAILEFAGEKYVVEIKGIKQESYQELTDDLTQASKACETVAKAVVQANLYMHLLELKKAVILIENKNNQNFKAWVTEHDAEKAWPYMHRAYRVKGGVGGARIGKGYPARVCSSPDRIMSTCLREMIPDEGRLDVKCVFLNF